MSALPSWRAGFELEVILGDLDNERFSKALRAGGGMDEASPAYCRALAARLKDHTGRAWSAPAKTPRRPGFYVIPEYGLDPLHWPEDRFAGVELLTPPLPFDEAEKVRSELIDAILEIDGDFNFFEDEHTGSCGWHINIDAGPDLPLSPARFIVGVEELALLARNDRLFSSYTGLQRHAVGVPLLRHLAHDPNGDHLTCPALGNLLSDCAGRSKGYAANFAKLLNGYVELRHFSANRFFDGPPLTEQLAPITASFEVGFSQSEPFEQAFLRKLTLLSRWLARHREKLTWHLSPGLICAQGPVAFGGERLGDLIGNGLIELNLLGRGQFEYIATIRDIVLPDIAEGVALLALDLAELHNLGLGRRVSRNKAFQRAVLQLATQLRKEPELASAAQVAPIEDTDRILGASLAPF